VWLAAKREHSAVDDNLPQHALWETFEEYLFVISPSLSKSIGYGRYGVRLTEDAIPTIFDKQRQNMAKGHTETGTSLYRLHMGEPPTTRLPCIDKYHFILKDLIMW